ncbi:hypothetical protein GCM10029992_36600 [Glycomyces albus]
MFTPIEFVRQRAAMIELFASGDTQLSNEPAQYFADRVNADPAAYADVGRTLFEAQRDMLIASDMYLFTPELADCAIQAMGELDAGDWLDLDPLPPGAVFGFTEPVRWPGGSSDTSSVMLPMPDLTFVSDTDSTRQLKVRLLVYTLKATMIDVGRRRSRLDTRLTVTGNSSDTSAADLHRGSFPDFNSTATNPGNSRGGCCCGPQLRSLAPRASPKPPAPRSPERGPRGSSRRRPGS